MPQAANAVRPDPEETTQEEAARLRHEAKEGREEELYEKIPDKEDRQRARRQAHELREALDFRQPADEWLADLAAARKRHQALNAQCLEAARKVKTAHDGARKAEADRTAIGDRRRALQKERGELEASAHVGDLARSDKARLAEVNKTLATDDSDERQRLRALQSGLELHADRAAAEYFEVHVRRSAVALNVLQLEHRQAEHKLSVAQAEYDTTSKAVHRAVRDIKGYNDWRATRNFTVNRVNDIIRLALKEAQQQ